MNRKLLKLVFTLLLATGPGWGHAQIADWSTQLEPLSHTGATYTVTTPGQLAWLANQVNQGATTLKDTTILLANDIDLNGYNWIPIGETIKPGDTNTIKPCFSGSFDGQGHRISNMNVTIQTDGETAYGGLFGLMTNGGDIKNVGIISGSVHVTAKNTALAGAIVANMQNSGSIEQCYAFIDIYTEITDPADSQKNSPRSGGILGEYANSPRTGKEHIRYCYSTGQIKAIGTQAATQNGIVAGGIAGRLEDVTVEYCYTTGAIQTEGGDNPYAGGIAGHCSYATYIRNCYSEADVTATSTRAAACYAIAGGISGTLSRGQIENCYATGAIQAENRQATTDDSEVYAGGIVGDLFIGGNVGNNTTVSSTVRHCLALNKSLTATTNRGTSRVCLSKVVGGYNTYNTNTSLENNYASPATFVKGAMILTGKADDLNGANWTTRQLLTGQQPPAVFTDVNGWLTTDEKLPVLKASASASDALGAAVGMETASFEPEEIIVATAADFTVALALEKVSTLRLADATYTLTEPLTLTKPIRIAGNGASACSIRGTWTIAPEAQADITLEGLTLTEEESNEKTAVHLINVTKPVNLTLRHVEMLPQRPGSDSDRRALISLQETVTSSEIQLDSTTLYLTHNSQIGLYNQGAFCHFSMNHSRITSKEGVDNLSAIRGMLTKGAEDCTYTIDNSTLSVGNNFHYAIWTQTPKQHFIVDHSEIYGWAAFYMQGAHRVGGADGMTLKASHSTFTGVGKSGSSNGFGVIVFEATENSTVEFDNCTITNKIIGNTKDFGFIPPFVFQMGGAGSVTDRASLKPSSNCTISLKQCTVQNTAEETTPVFVGYFNVFGDSINGYLDYHKNKIEADAETRFLNQDGSNSLLIQNGDTIRNITKSLPTAIVRVDSIEEKVDGHTVSIPLYIPIAYPGDNILATGLKLTEALTQLNQPGAMPDSYIVPDGILIPCKDGYLATGEKEAKAHAERLTNAAVFHLKQETKLFTMQAVGNNRLVIATDTTWSDATHANRSVWVKAGVMLTVSTPMPLDTLFMEEGAQVKPEAAIEVKALQWLDSVPGGRWKAFGFPVSRADELEVTDWENTPVTVQSDPNQDGVWFAGFTQAPAFGYKSTFEPAGLIASEKNRLLRITSKAPLSLEEKAAPEAPSASHTFTLVANPNTFAMTLNQTAYILDEEGKNFERRENPVVPAFGSFVLADEQTTATLRSFELKGEVTTSNEVIPTAGYYVTTSAGTLTIHTAWPVEVWITNIHGQVFYKGKVSADGWQLAVPAGIYSVNGELFYVK